MPQTTPDALRCIHGPGGCTGLVQLNWLEFETSRHLRCQTHRDQPAPSRGAAAAPAHGVRRGVRS